MNKFLSVILIVFVVILGNASSLMANGISFYERIAIEENGKLNFIVLTHDNLPDSQRRILACQSNRHLCALEIINTLEKELVSQQTRNMKAWKHFLIGTVHFEQQNFKKALEAYQKATKNSTDPALKSAAMHRIVDIYLILRDMKSTINSLKILNDQFPTYKAYDRIFVTYPWSLCDPAWWVCIEPTSISKLRASIPIFEEIKEKQIKLKSLLSEELHNKDEYVQTSIQLGKLYEKICPIDTMFDRVCPDALKI
jgi:tetratricopeptide (TPR) repeat protein